MKLILLVLLTACAVESVEPETDPSECCWYWPLEDSVRACVRDRIVDWSAYQQDADGCIPVTCHPSTIGVIVKVCP